mgnify:FL=1
MKILFLTFYFEPDLCAGSFRNTPLFRELLQQMDEKDWIHVITTQPNRYHSFHVEGQAREISDNYRIDRIRVPEHKSGFIDQVRSFRVFYNEALRLAGKERYDLVYASSSRLFTAFLGRRIAGKQRIPLYLDIRDIFVDTIKDVFKKRKMIRIPAGICFGWIERYTFAGAKHINLVSEGFKTYFEKYRKSVYSYFTNGIDDIFLDVPKSTRQVSGVKIITYAGNIGSGQGLEKVIPMAAQKLGDRYFFRIIGDGGVKALLRVHNVELLNPVSREKLIGYYNDSDFLLLHLNDLEAFKKVLPSKLFEYAAFDKPIVAGVGGYASQFIQENLSNYILFAPTDVESMVEQILKFDGGGEKQGDFVKRFARKNIMKEMARSILECR